MSSSIDKGIYMSCSIDRGIEAMKFSSSQHTVNEVGDHSGSLLSGIFLISGTSIGAGMLALPVVTSHAGFFPSLVILAVCWIFMMATGLLFLEATLWMKDGANVLSMARRFLGRSGEIFAGGSFLFLYYCLMIAYLSGGSPIFRSALGLFVKSPVNPILSYWIFGISLTAVVAFGAKVIDRTNFVFMAALIIAYFILLGAGFDEVHFSYLENQNWGMALFAAPTLFSAFGFHNVVPSISTYLSRDRKKLRLAIIIGTSIPFVVYAFWQWLIIGTVPAELISEIESKGTPIGAVLQQVTQSYWISAIANYFAFFAIITSILGVALSMVDFLGDGLGARRTGFPRAGLTLLVFIPPMLLGAGNPALFVQALGIAGGFGEALLNGLLPIALVWIGRYHLRLSGKKLIPGGKGMLTFLCLFTFLIIGIEVCHLMRYSIFRNRGEFSTWPVNK